MKTNQTISITRDSGIDWVKAIAITLVIFTHCFWSPSERTMIIFPFLVELGVPLFTLVTGYNYYNSLKKNDRNTLQWYFKYGSRILIPFAIAMVIEVFYMTLVLHYPVKRMIFIIATGGMGQGSYYTVILMQIIILFPLLFRLINTKYGFISIILGNLIFEIWVSVANMNPEIYRLLCLRYLIFLATGAAYARFKKQLAGNKEFILSVCFLVIGIICIYILNYSGIKPVIFKQWTTTSMPTVFMAFALFLLIKRFLTYQNRLIEIISKSSFHIFLTQMVYYSSLDTALHILLDIRSEFIAFPINLCICVSCGILFYYVETSVVKYIKAKL